ncbi:MAG: tape measure protein, partial [Arenimonas sp.]
MAILSDDEVKIRIGAETTGTAAVEDLANNIDRLATQGGQAAPQLGRLAGELRRMQTDADAAAASVSRSGDGLGDFVGKLRPIAGAIAAAFGVAEVARMAADFDSLNRSMAAIQGQGAKAAAEVAYLTDAANRLGLEVQSVSKTYASWLASIKGTALEGEKGRAVFESVAGAMAKLGKSAADTDGAMMALGQMVSKGKVSMEELRQQLAERLPGAMQA